VTFESHKTEKILCGPRPRIWVWSQKREKREKREERENVEEIREEREGENLVCVTKPKFLVMVHTMFLSDTLMGYDILTTKNGCHYTHPITKCTIQSLARKLK
jgi:hypothetical protein